MAQATFGAGCFWGVEAAFKKVPGVESTTVGYSGGTTASPTYEQVCSGTTGHAEVVCIEYQPDQVSYRELLEVFWQIHDPTQVNRQGPDVGTQYRSVIFYHDSDQRQAAEQAKQQREATGEIIATLIEPAGPFYAAEDYHQDYMAKQCRL